MIYAPIARLGGLFLCYLFPKMVPLGPDNQLIVLVTLVSCFLYQASMIIWKSFSQRYIKSYRGLSNDEKIEWDARAPSTLHAIVLCSACIYLFLFTDDFNESKVNKKILTPLLSEWPTNPSLTSIYTLRN